MTGRARTNYMNNTQMQLVQVTDLTSLSSSVELSCLVREILALNEESRKELMLLGHPVERPFPQFAPSVAAFCTEDEAEAFARTFDL